MGYSHMTYGVDLERLKALWGSQDETLLEQILRDQAEELDSNDDFFESMRDDDDDDDEEDEDEEETGGFPDSRTVLREIFAGSIPQRDGGEAVYGYVLKILCGHLGEMLGGDVAAISQHPYKSQLIANGPPLPIPIDRGDFPEVYHLPLDQIPEELRRVDEAIARGGRPAGILAAVTGAFVWKRMNPEEMVEDMQAYRDALTEAQARGLSLVSFRH